VLRKFHEKHGHPGKNRSVQLITNYYWWKDIIKDIKNYVDSCENCQSKQRDPQNTFPAFHSFHGNKSFNPGRMWRNSQTLNNNFKVRAQKQSINKTKQKNSQI
jgi:hypothetical protein